MIVKEISTDPRLPKIGKDAAFVFAMSIPHQGPGGIIVRNPAALKLMSVPGFDYTTCQIESIIQKWLRTKPPLAVESICDGEKVLIFKDFLKCNRNLVSSSQRVLPSLPIKNGKTGYEGNRIEGNRIERNTTPKPPSTPTQKIIERYLEIKGVPYDGSLEGQKAFRRWLRDAGDLLDAMKGLEDPPGVALECLEDRAKEWARLPDWTLKAVAERAPEWLAKKAKEAGRGSR